MKIAKRNMKGENQEVENINMLISTEQASKFSNYVS